MKNIIITSTEEFERLLSTTVRSELSTYFNKEEKTEKYLTRAETARMLSIHPITLDNWTKRGYINFTRIGQVKKRYRLSDIESLKSSNNPKYRRNNL